MGSFSDFWENAVLNHLFDNTAYPAPGTIYVALSTADPTDDGSGIAEPVGNNYARVATTGVTWTTSTAGTLNNGAMITFPTASGSWGTVSYWALFDALSGGNMLAHGSVTTPKAITLNDVVSFPVGTLIISQT